MPSAAEARFEKVPVSIFPSPTEAASALAREVADLVISRAEENRPVVLGLATGSTPVPFYRELVRMHRDEGLSFKNVTTFNLDEYFGLNADHPESYATFMRDQLFDHIDIPAENINVPDGTVGMEAVFEYCESYEQAIRDAGGLDFQILGIGRTGHIGFNEPGSAEDSRTRLIALDRITRADAAPDFLGINNVPRFAITMGVGTILEARKVVLMAWGGSKAGITAEAVEGARTEAVSASFLQGIEGARFVVDSAAASGLTRSVSPWLTRRVIWDSAETRRAVSWLANKAGRPVLKLTDGDYNENGMGSLLTQEGGTAYDLNIRIFNDLGHTITGWPGGKPDCDDRERPESAAPFPKKSLVLSPEPGDAQLAMGGTIDRLVSQGHEVSLIHLTSGSLRVPDAAAETFARTLLERGEDRPEWSTSTEYAKTILAQIEAKGNFGEHPAELRHLKGLIRRGEARDAAAALGLSPKHVSFLDLPFYEEGRYRRFTPGGDDIAALKKLLTETDFHQIYLTGNLADPSSVAGITYQLILDAGIPTDKSTWLYRAHEAEPAPHEIAMAVPMSPAQLEDKVSSLTRFGVLPETAHQNGAAGRALAASYDALGLPEYEAIEAFERP
ncbi:glucosamine-6-phosphate deaminase [Verrucomicrobiales bacterium]|nr:glucosamine-6-phosphate deaminase [Verrucomicrobiales bacterium]